MKPVVKKPVPAEKDNGGVKIISKLKHVPYRVWHFVVVLFIYVFCTLLFGDVFQRAQQDCYVSANPERMTYVLRLPFGEYHWLMRYLMLTFKNVWLGGAVLTLLLVGTACCLSRILNLSRRWKLLSFVLPLLTLGFLTWRGLRIYFHDEPSLVMGVPFALFLVMGVVALAVTIVRGKKAVKCDATSSASWVSVSVVAVMMLGLVGFTQVYRQNDVLISRMQNRLLQADWEGIADDALSARLGSRPVAAYYAISLVQQNQLLERLFDFAFDYPQDGPNLSAKGRSEANIYESDCNFYAGLVNSAYRAAMERHVMAGPSIYVYKRMALCCILNGELALAKRYIKVLEEVPFEEDFVARYAPMIDNPKLITNDPELVKVLQLAPLEMRYEQGYRRPVFLGYNVGLAYGSDQTLVTSAAATLYSKDMIRFLNLATVLRQKMGGRLPLVVRQAIMAYSVSHDEVKQAFPEVCNDRMLLANFQAFVAEAKPYLKDKVELRKRMKDNWLGSYYYYYFCENNEPYQVRKVESSAGGVN